MTKKENKEDRGGCFAWLIRLKRAVNERWAKSLNAFRRKHSNQVRPEDELNDTGTPDMVISKIPVSPKQSVIVAREYITDRFVKGFSPMPDVHTKPDKDIVDDVHAANTVQVIANTDGEPDKEQVRLYILDAINNAKMKIQTQEGKPSTIQDDMSMTSSVISDLATIVVNDSLTNIRVVEGMETKKVIEDTLSISSGEISGFSPMSDVHTKPDTDIVNDVHATHTVQVIANTDGEPDKEQVRLYILDAINNAKMKIETQEGTPSIIQDDMSMTSSVLSDLATIVVNDSLTNIRVVEGMETKKVIEDTSSISSGEISGFSPMPDVYTKPDTDIIDDVHAASTVHAIANTDGEPDKEQAAATEALATTPAVCPSLEPHESIYLVRLYILDVINNAKMKMNELEDTPSIIQDNMSMTSSVLSDIATAVVNDSLTNIIEDMGTKQVVEDTSSLSSGEISDIATAVVNDSLTNIVEDMETKQVIKDTPSLSSGEISDIARAVVNDSLTNIVEDMGHKQVIEDTSSLSSGEISVLAEAAVTKSLTSIINEYQNDNQSARSRPRTITEMLEHLNIDTSIGLVKGGEDDFLPPCSP